MPESLEDKKEVGEGGHGEGVGDEQRGKRRRWRENQEESSSSS